MTDIVASRSPNLTLLGSIVRLQFQTAGLKVGERGRRAYVPTPIRSVDWLHLAPHGITGQGPEGSDSLDVHHRDHPDSKFAGDNAVSVLFTHHYDLMRARFGDHLPDGIAGESMLVETNRRVMESNLLDGLVIETEEGPALLRDLRVAEPCVEYTRYCLRRAPEERADPILTESLEFLRAGMRGFYARYSGTPVLVRLGDKVYLPA